MGVSNYLSQKSGAEKLEKTGIAGFTTYSDVNRSFEYSSEAPTTYLEDGSSVEDTIVLNPVTLSIEGVVADIFESPDPITQKSQGVSRSVGQISLYTPARTKSQAQRVQSVVNEASQSTTRIDSLIDSGTSPLDITGDQSESGDIQQKFIDKMESLHLSRQTCSIDMPYRTFRNMRITSISFSKDNQTDATTFNLSAVEIRVAEQAVSEISNLIASPSAGLDGQAEGETDKGTQEGEDAPKSLLSVFLGGDDEEAG